MRNPAPGALSRTLLIFDVPAVPADVPAVLSAVLPHPASDVPNPA